jgi:hypothetical protein
MVLSYTTPTRQRQVVEVEFELDGERFTARKPKESILVYLTAAGSESATTSDQMYAVMQFINGCLTPAAQFKIQSRLRDYDDDLELDDLMQLMKDLSEHFGAQDAPRAMSKAQGRPGAGRIIAPDGTEALDITPAGANRAARRAKPVKKTPGGRAPALPR